MAFLQPVDIKGLGIPDYFEIIMKPLDLGTVEVACYIYKPNRTLYHDILISPPRKNWKKQSTVIQMSLKLIYISPSLTAIPTTFLSMKLSRWA